ncbi:hypothetical protein BASA81_008697 [Batrachochytrium salamandrivorans]|nr:hypothetical protein BASA81_008697 [Batrachochytrium salamandrivorans]
MASASNLCLACGHASVSHDRPCLHFPRQFPRGGGPVASKFTPQLHTSQLSSDSDSCGEGEDEDTNEEELIKQRVKLAGLELISAAVPSYGASIKRNPGQLDLKSMVMWFGSWHTCVAQGTGFYSKVEEADRMALVEAMEEANIALQETGIFLGSLSQCVAQCETYKLSKTQWDTKLMKLMDDVEKKLQVSDNAKREMDMQQVMSSLNKLNQEVKKAKAVAEEKRQGLEGDRRMDAEIAELTAILEAQNLEKVKVKREFQASQDKVAFVKKAAATTKHKLEQQIEDIRQAEQECKQLVTATGTVHGKLLDAMTQFKHAEERLRVSKEQFKLRAAAAAAQEAQFRPTHCVFCGEGKSGLGLLLPCRHGMCIDCLVEGQEMGKLYEIPFFHPKCNDCDATLERIAFAEFEFDPLLGMRTNK